MTTSLTGADDFRFFENEDIALWQKKVNKNAIVFVYSEKETTFAVRKIVN